MIVRGAVRNLEPWRNRAVEQETVEDKLNRLEKEEAEAAGEEQEEKNAMADLEARTQNAKDEIEVADALDRIRMQNAARARASTSDIQDGVMYAAQERLDEQDRHDAEEARLAFERHRGNIGEEILDEIVEEEPIEEAKADVHDTSKIATPATRPIATIVRKKKQKKDFAGMLGIKGKKA